MAKLYNPMTVGGYPATVSISGDGFKVTEGSADVQIPPGIVPPQFLSETIEGHLCVFQLVSQTRFDGLPTNAGYVLVGRYETEIKMVKPEKFDDDTTDGLYAKYRVFKEPDDVGEHPIPVTAFYHRELNTGKVPVDLDEVEGFIFPLKPDTDRHARVALAAYAWSIRDEKPHLWEDLTMILEDLPQDF